MQRRKKITKKKSRWFRTLIFHFAWRAKLHAEFEEVVSVRTGNPIFFDIHRFSNFRPILALLIQLRALRGISMTQCTRTFV